MNANISQEELKVLAHLHEHAKGYDSNFPFYPVDIKDALGLSDEQLWEMGSYLAAHELVGIDALPRPLQGNPDDAQLLGVWLTALGEDYMRELEKHPSIARRITVGSLSDLWGMGKGVIVDVAAKVLGDIAMGRHP